MKVHHLTSVFFAVFVASTIIVAAAGESNRWNTRSDENHTCGDSAYWYYFQDNHTLIINGTGKMNDYGSYSAAPWYEYHEQINFIEISEGITSIGRNAFYGCKAITGGLNLSCDRRYQNRVAILTAVFESHAHRGDAVASPAHRAR